MVYSIAGVAKRGLSGRERCKVIEIACADGLAFVACLPIGLPPFFLALNTIESRIIRSFTVNTMTATTR
jgi:hypothetical protein